MARVSQAPVPAPEALEHGRSVGEVRWHVQALDQDDVPVATYVLLTTVSANPG